MLHKRTSNQLEDLPDQLFNMPPLRTCLMPFSKIPIELELNNESGSAEK